MINSFLTYWNSNEQPTNIGDSEILKIGSTLHGILNNIPFKNGNQISTPTIVVVGSQSSGKSSVLNGLISMDILPTGSSMVTRTPLNLQLIQTDKEMYAEFGNYDNSQWNSIKKVILTNPNPNIEEINIIRKQIKHLTTKYAGEQLGVSDKEICLKIFSPYVPNINLIDLPGLTMVACTDKGQPSDIKIQIRNMITKYIKSERSTILCVMPAREDLEADIALDLIKEIDINFDRTIGVLTKLDLMNQGTSVLNYLTKNVSKDLDLHYGYYAVRNRTNKEIKELTIQEGFSKEIEYFRNHPMYNSKKISNNLGISNLGKVLTNILVENIKIHICPILEEITKQQNIVEEKLLNLGEPLPDSVECKISMLNVIVNKLCTKFSEALNYRGSDINSGRLIKDVFIKYRESINNVKPFDNKICTEAYIKEIIKNCEGNHMSFPLPPIEVLENCLLDKNNNPFNKLSDPCIKCIIDISGILLSLTDKLLDSDEMDRFPKVKNELKNIIKKTITNCENESRKKIKEIIDMEKNYIWTDDAEFKDNLRQLFSNLSAMLDSNVIKKVLESYFSCIKKIIQHIIPKSIMLYLVKNVENRLKPILFEKIQHKEFYNLLYEETEQTKKRELFITYKEKLNSAKKIINTI